MDETEKQIWEIVRSVPGLNVAYGSVRCIVYVIKKDKDELTDSAIVAAKGAAQTAVIAATIFAAPVTIPVASGVLTGIAAKSVSETMEVIVFVVTNNEQFHEKTSEEKETIFYNKIKNVARVGALYSAFRVPVYLFKRNKQQSIESGANLMENSGDIAVQAGIRMIPGIDDQLQTVLEKTTKHALKFLSKKVMAQVSLRNLPLEDGLAEIAKVETDIQTIMQLTNDPSLSQTSKVSGNHEEESTAIDERRGKCAMLSYFYTCCCCCCSRQSLSSSDLRLRSLSNKKDENTSELQNGSNSHVLILTE